jgi:DNA-binding PadR family transcriptional regulator
MDADGLVARVRDPANRRVHVVELTEAGEAAFERQRTAAVAFDRRLRREVADGEVAVLGDLLDRSPKRRARPRHVALRGKDWSRTSVDPFTSTTRRVLDG